MKYTEERGDLFQVDEKYYLCHCISADFALGKGIAVEFNRRFNMKNKLKQFCNIDTRYCGAILIDRVFNLVTKERYYNKPTYSTIECALIDMRQQMSSMDIHFLAMPLIGCGLDDLKWSKVSEIVKDVFRDTDVEILVVVKA